MQFRGSPLANSYEDRSVISVVMPCFNSAETLAESVASALGQTYGNLELVVVDDGSTDSSLALLQEIQAEDSRLTIIAQPNKGAGAARNRGISAAKGEFVAFLDADDTWTPDCLEKLHSGLESSPDAVLAYCGWQNLGLEPQCCKPYIPPDYENDGKLECFLTNCPWPIHAALVRRRDLVEVGGFDEQWSSCMDFDLWLRLGGFRKVVRVPAVMAFYHHRLGRAQITSNHARVALNVWRIQSKFIVEHPEVTATLGRQRLREITHGELMTRGFKAYWKRDLPTARLIFRQVMRFGYGRLNDWRYMIPSLLPEKWHRQLIAMLESRSS